MKKIIAALTLTALLCTAGGTALAVDDTASDWAKDSLSQAEALGFVPQRLQADYQQNITREEFAAISMGFLAAQYGYGSTTEYYAVLAYRSKQDPEAPRVSDVGFSDYNGADVQWAHALGVVNGRGDGTFDPEGDITRQEAAAMLYRAYAVYGGRPDVQDSSFGATFSDAGQVAEWARDSVETIWTLGVMGGTGDGLFDPLGPYTREQCIITFLRLWQSGPVGRAQENVKPLASPDDVIAAMVAGNGALFPFTVDQRLDTPSCTVLYGAYRGGPHGSYYHIFLVYPDGGCREVMDGNVPYVNVWNILPPAEELALSEDQSRITFRVTFDAREENLATGKVLHEKGVYHVAVELSTGKVDVTFTAQ